MICRLARVVFSKHTEEQVHNDRMIAWVLTMVALIGGLIFIWIGMPHFEAALYGFASGAAIGKVQNGIRGMVNGAAFGLLIGLLSPIWYDPLEWFLDLPPMAR
jgi:hypothetical protein